MRRSADLTSPPRVCDIIILPLHHQSAACLRTWSVTKSRKKPLSRDLVTTNRRSAGEKKQNLYKYKRAHTSLDAVLNDARKAVMDFYQFSRSVTGNGRDLE